MVGNQYIKLFESYLKDISNNELILYHQSDAPNIKKFKRPYSHLKKKVFDYTFFSFEEQGFLQREYTYRVKIKLAPNEIFVIYSQDILNAINKNVPIQSSFPSMENEIRKLVSENNEYLLKVWKESNTDNKESVSELYKEKFNKIPSDDEILMWFLTTWNDSWCLLESDLLIDFIESRGFKSFVTIEDGQLNVAVNNKDSSIFEIISNNPNYP